LEVVEKDLKIGEQLYITSRNSLLWSWASKQTTTFVLLDHSQILGYACISVYHEHHTNPDIFSALWDIPNAHENIDNKHLDYFWDAQSLNPGGTSELATLLWHCLKAHLM
jgi:hypothetical protein